MFSHVNGIVSGADEGYCQPEGAEAGMLELILTHVKGEESVVSCIADEFRDFAAFRGVLTIPKPFGSLNMVDLSLTFRW